jgi:uncharacterized protein (TIGR00255 family)
MTGYGRGEGSSSGFTVTAELRSVNHRYADFVFRIPREFYPLEERIRRLLQGEIKRGRVEVSVALEKLPSGLQEIEVNHALAEAYCRALHVLSQRLSLPMDAGVVNLAQLPEVLHVPGLAIPPDQVWPALEEALQGALAMLLLQRRNEGENLYRDLSERCRVVEEKLRQAAARAPLAHEEHRVRLDRRFRELLAGHFEEGRVLMECAVLVERMGIDEELVRLESHRRAFQKTLAAPEPSGRKLDFIIQEMLREVNTIGSKAADYALAGLVVEIKAELEKIREQIQNIE